MGKFTVRAVTAAALLLTLLVLAPVLVGQKKANRKLTAISAAKVARGKYLVEQVGMCGDCHSPRNEKAEPVPGQWLHGAPLTFKPVEPVPVWAANAPNLAGLPGWEKDAAIKYLMTGVARNDLPTRPPMPRYRFNEPDAEAIVAYLRSLALQK
jgi:hypothetical protein